MASSAPTSSAKIRIRWSATTPRLIVNRLDEAFAKKRWKKDGTADETADEAKCQRNQSNSSTAKLFPARPSPDIDNLGGSIR